MVSSLPRSRREYEWLESSAAMGLWPVMQSLTTGHSRMSSVDTVHSLCPSSLEYDASERDAHFSRGDRVAEIVEQAVEHRFLWALVGSDQPRRIQRLA